MALYQCIKKCYAYDRKWDVGDTIESESPLNHHFAPVYGEPIPIEPQILVPPQLKDPAYDPMKPTASSVEAKSLGQAQRGGPKLKTGMAAGLKDDEPVHGKKTVHRK